MKESEKQSQKNPARADRRSFIKLAGAGVVGGGAALASVVTGAEASSAAPADQGQYRETDHVKRYYELAKFM